MMMETLTIRKYKIKCIKPSIWVMTHALNSPAPHQACREFLKLLNKNQLFFPEFKRLELLSLAILWLDLIVASY